MAKNDDEFDLDDFDFDDFDFDAPEFEDPSSEADDRTAVARLGAGFFEGSKDTLLSGANLERLMRLSLPSGYSQALNVKDTALESTKQLYNSALEELRPAADTIRRTTDKILPRVKSKLPNFLADKIDSLGWDEEYTPESAGKIRQDSQNNEIAAAMAELFKAQGAAQTEQQARTESDTLVRQQVDDNKFGTQLGQINKIAKGVSRLVGYQEQILSKYQQKSLELQYRHYFASRDLLELTTLHNDKMLAAVNIVVKNTALPEAVKIQSSELAGQMIKQRLVGTGLNTISNFTGNFASQLMENLQGAAAGVLSPISMLASLEGIDDKTKTVGFEVGKAAVDFGTDWVGNKISPKLGQNGYIRRGGNFLSKLFTALPQRMSRWANSETEGFGWRSTLVDMFKGMIPGFSLNDQVGQNQLFNSDQPATWTKQSHRTINEVIPAYLAQISRWTKATATGSDEGVETYNLVRGGFSTEKTYQRDLTRQILTPQENRGLRQEIDRYVESIDKNGQLTEAQRRDLRRVMVANIAKGGHFEPKIYAERETYGTALSDDQIDELTDFFNREFELDFDGESMDESPEMQERLNEAMLGFDRLQTLIPAVGDRVRAFADAVGMDTLRKMGFVVRTAGGDRIDFEKIWDLLTSDEALQGLEEGEAITLPKDERDTRPFHERMREAVQKGRQARQGPGGPLIADDDELDNFTGNVLPRRQSFIQPNSRDFAQPFQATNLTADFDPYMGPNSHMVRELQLIRRTIESGRLVEQQGLQIEALGTIAQLLQTIGTGGGWGGPGGGQPTPPPGGSKLKWIRGITDNVWSALKSYTKLTRDAYGLAGKGLWGGAKILGGAGVDGTKAFFRKGKARLDDALENSDLYVAGRDRFAALRADLLRAGEYFNEDGSPITKWSDIRGQVRNKVGKVVLDAEDYARGIYNTHGKSMAGKLAGLLGDAASMYAKVTTAPYRALYRLAQRKFRARSRSIKEQMKDIYVRGEYEPRLRAVLLEAGEYRDRLTGDIVRNYTDIKGDVIDRADKIILSVKDIRESGGLFDQWGQRLKGFGASTLKNLGSLYLSATMLPVRALGAMGRGLGRMFRGKGGGSDDDLVTLNYHQLTTLDKIWQLLDSKFNKRVRGDESGDGVRDNSWVDIMNRRKEKQKEDAEANAAKAGGGTNLFSGLGATLAGLFGRKKKDEEEDDDDGSFVDDAMDAVDTANDLGDMRERRGRRKARKARSRRGGGRPPRPGGPPKPGMLRTAATWGLRGGMLAGRLALTPLIWAGTALVSAIGAPVLIGTAVAGAVAYGGYKLYQHIAKTPTVLRGLRFAQYGIDVRDAEQIGKIIQLEGTLKPYLSYPEGGLPQIGSGVNVNEVLGIFGLDGQADQERQVGFIQWFTNRFKPVYLAHMGAVHAMARGQALQDIDDKLPAEMGAAFIDAVKLESLREVYANTDISPFSHDLSCDEDDVAGWIEKAQDFYKEKLKEKPAVKEESKAQLVAAAAGVAAVTTTGGTAQGGNAPNKPSEPGFWGNLANTLRGSSLIKALTSRTAATIIGGPVGAWLYSKVFGEKPNEIIVKRAGAMDPVMGGRFRVYGLVKMEVSKVQNLQELEALHWQGIKYSEGNVAYYAGVDAGEIYSRMARKFGIVPTDEQTKQDWFIWYRFRFLPALLRYAGAVRSKMSIDAKDAPTKLKPEELQDVLKQMAEATSEFDHEKVSVWEVTASPWPKYVLNQDPASIDERLELLKSREKDAVMAEAYATVTTPKPTSGPSKATPGLTGDFESVPSPYKGYATGEITQRTGKAMIDRMKDSYGKKDPVDTGFTLLTGRGGGQSIIHPGGGTGGDINAIPMPRGKGWNNVKDTIIAAANMAGVDPATAATVAAVESSFDPDIVNKDSSATGLFQFIRTTWDEQIKAHGDKYGIAPNTPPTDARANALMGMEFLKTNARELKGVLGREPNDVDLYAAHFLGAGGAKRFFRAPTNDIATRHVKENVPGVNRDIFFDKGRPRTVAEVYQEWNRRMEAKRKSHGLSPGQQYAAAEVSLTPVEPEFGGSYAGSGFNPVVEEPAPAAGRVADAVAQGRETAPLVMAHQPTASSGLTTPAMVTNTGQSAAQLAVIAQRQASTENGALLESMSSVSGILTDQLTTQREIRTILEQILQRGGMEAAPAQGETTAATSTSSSATSSTARPATKAPVSVKRVS